jgi:hypothetical protein
MLKIITDHRTTSQLHRSSLHLASSISITQNQLRILIENMNSLQHNTIVSLEVPLKRYDSVAPEDGMSSDSSMSETDALLDEQNDTPVAANIGPNVRAPWQSVKWCASSLAKSVQLGARLVHGQYSSVVARVLNRQEGYHDAVEMQPVPGRAEFLMLVYSGKHAVDKLHQVRLPTEGVLCESRTLQQTESLVERRAEPVVETSSGDLLRTICHSNFNTQTAQCPNHSD